MKKAKSAYLEHGKHYKQGHVYISDEFLEHYRQEFMKKEEWLSASYERVEPYDYYRDMFPEGSFEREGQADKRPNGMLSIIRDQGQRGRSYPRMVFDDLGEILANLDKGTVVISPVGYSGNRKRADLAYELYGMVIDLDDVGTRELGSLVYQMENGILPMATYLKNSGTGIHVVYLFEEPVPAYKKYYDSLNRLKAALSDLIWSQYTSRETDKQFQGIFQSFRVVGSPTKLGDDYRTSAYKIGDKTTIEELNWYVSKKNRCNLEENEGISLADARELYPEWYQRRIVEGRAVGDYQLTEAERVRRRAWYDAWVARIKAGAKDGNRHGCICVLFHYAMKAEIPLEEAYQDALALLPYLDSLTKKPGNSFTVADIDAAKTFYSRAFIKLSRKSIQRLTGIDIGQTKRNHRSQQDHLRAERIRDAQGQVVENPCKVNRERTLQAMRDSGAIMGRPHKQAQVQEWRAAHPGGSKADCIRDTGLTKPTVYKWWAMAS